MQPQITEGRLELITEDTEAPAFVPHIAGLRRGARADPRNDSSCNPCQVSQKLTHPGGIVEVLKTTGALNDIVPLPLVKVRVPVTAVSVIVPSNVAYAEP